MPSHPSSAWERLGQLLVRRRIEMDPRYSNRRIFEAERWPDHYRTINAIELGQKDNAEPATIAALETAYRLAPNAIERALEGGSLEPVPEDAPRLRVAPPVSPEMLPDDAPASPSAVAFARAFGVDPDDPRDPFVQSVRRDITDAIMKHGAGATGEQIFHGHSWSSYEAGLWSDPRAPRKDAELLIAGMRADRARHEAGHGNDASRIGLVPVTTSGGP